MNFKTFPVATTTIFPISNSVTGGQLVTEWNLRSRGFVPSASSVEYDYAASFVHGASDFDVRVEQDDAGVILSNSTLELLPGKAILNGHYVKQEGHMLVDLLQGNKDLQLRGEDPLTGKLAVGLRVYYATEATMVGAMAPENSDDVYEGVQVVVMPQSKLITPEDSPSDESKVNCHLKLATFTFLDNEIRGVVQNADKLKCIDAERIANIDRALAGNYVTKDGINPKKLYVLAGKNVNDTVNDTWCDATDSLFVWDKNPTRTSTKPIYDHAQFIAKDSGVTSLALPHKNIDGMKVTLDEKSSDYNKDEYYEAVTIDLPAADFSNNTAGTVTPAYTKRIKNLSNKVDSFFHLLKGKQVAYIETLTSKDQLPNINDNWVAGDYTLVSTDNVALASEGANSAMRPPSTLYAVLPGAVKAIKFYGTGKANSDAVPLGLNGVQLGTTVESSTKPVSSNLVSSASLNLQGALGESDIVPASTEYTTPEGIVYTDDGNGTLVYDSEKNDNSSGASSALQAALATFEGESSQYFSIAQKTVNEISGYAISCNGKYLTATKAYPSRMYFSDTLTKFGIFNFVETDDASQSGVDVKTVTNSTARPVEMVCKALVMLNADSLNTSKLLYNVDDLVKQAQKLAENVPVIETDANALINALNSSNSSTVTSLASQLLTSVTKAFGESSDVYEEVQKAKTLIENSLDDLPSRDTQVKNINDATTALKDALNKINTQCEYLETLITTIDDQAAVISGDKVDWSIYGRVAAYVDDNTSYLYVSENAGKQDQLWQITESSKSIMLFNSYYGKALTQQDEALLRGTTYSINYENGSITGLPVLGTVSYSYYSNNVTQSLLNYFTVTSETHGVANEDYFVCRYRTDSSNYIDYYYVVTETGPREWSSAIWVSGPIPVATETAVGGFLNVPDSALDGGYVKVNSDGYLQLVDYDLIRTGAAAYQLGEDVAVSAGISSSDIQTYLNEYVNNRVAFANSNQIATVTAKAQSGTAGVYAHPEVINVTVNVSAEDSESEITMCNIDSRFGSCVYLHLTGTANSNTTIVLSNIEKLRIDASMQYDESDPPKIIVNNCCLYYDCSVLNKIAQCNSSLEATGMQDISFWYERYEDTDAYLVVNDMTVSEINAPKITDVIDFWNAVTPNDNHYHVALHSLTFASDATIMGVGMLIANDTTSNIQDGHFISAATFTVPQGAGLNYPNKLMTRQIKITGTFESGYMTDGGYVMQDTKFTALTQSYSKYDNASTISGSILFHVDTNIIDADFGGVSTEAWEPDTFHLFQGAAM